MATIAEFKKRFASFYGNEAENLNKTILNQVNRTADVIRDLNMDQVLYGRDAKGKEITPGYLSDPFFETPEQAQAYYDRKKELQNYHNSLIMASMSNKVQLFPNKRDDVPNLLITGTKFFWHFFIDVSEDSYTIGSTGDAAPDIERKYDNLYGLALQSREYYYYWWMRPAIWQSLINNLNKK